MNEATPTPDVVRSGRENLPISYLADYEHLLPEAFVTFVRSVNGWEELEFSELLDEIASYATQQELTPSVRDGIERIERIQQIRDFDIGGDNAPIHRFLASIKKPQLPEDVSGQILDYLAREYKCHNIFDVYVIGVENLRMTAPENPAMIYAADAVFASMVRTVENIIVSYQEEDNGDEQEEGNHSEEYEQEQSGHVYVSGHNVEGDLVYNTRKGVGKFTLIVAMILSGVTVQRGYIDVAKIRDDVQQAWRLIVPKELPKAIQVTPEEMRELEAKERQ